jgi:hypothetical protein
MAWHMSLILVTQSAILQEPVLAHVPAGQMPAVLMASDPDIFFTAPDV